MSPWRILCCILLTVLGPVVQASAQEESTGSIRGTVYDGDFEAPLPNATVTILELSGTKVVTGNDGLFLFAEVPAAIYTLVFSKDGYVQQVRTDLVVSDGKMTELEIYLSGDFTDMEEFVVQDLLGVGSGSEGSLLKLRLESPALIDSISSDLMGKAGVSDAAGALRLVAGATVKDGKSAVIRGLPDRYISTQLNGVRLPSADEDKRAVELDQFPAAVIDNIRVTKTFTPDQMGDASGGAVDIILKGIPSENIFRVKSEFGMNTHTFGRRDLLGSKGGGVSTFGRDHGLRAQQLSSLGENWSGAVGVSPMDASMDYKWSAALGGSTMMSEDVRVGGFLDFFYERDSSHVDDRRDDSYWIDQPGEGLTPEYSQGSPDQDQFFTSLLDITQTTQSVQWGTLGAVGLETENNSFQLNYLTSRTAEETTTLAEDSRGKEYYFPDYDRNDTNHPGNNRDFGLGAAPETRLETLAYTERTTTSIQLGGSHTLPIKGIKAGDLFRFGSPEIEWKLSKSTADSYSPDRRQLGTFFQPTAFTPGVPPFTEDSFSQSTWEEFKPSDNINLGNLQRIWKSIEETSDQRRFDFIMPFEQWSGQSGFFKFGMFDDQVKRNFNQDTFTNGGQPSTNFEGSYDDFWSNNWKNEDHPIFASEFDVDYRASQDVSAWYFMTDMPLMKNLNLVGGIRYESTAIRLTNQAEDQAFWFPDGATAPVSLAGDPGAADVDFSQRDSLPSLTLISSPLENFTVRVSYSRTIARQTFKELTPILQQEFLGGPIFIGDPNLQMSELENYDVRLDYTPFSGGLISTSYFKKNIDNPIEYVQRLAGFTFTTPVNYPKGSLSGVEFEFRQELQVLDERLDGLTFGLNATFMNSEVTLPDDEAALFDLPNIAAPMGSRDMVNAPDKLFNAFITYDIAPTDTHLGLFYTVQGDTLVSGAGVSNANLVPNIYATRYDTLNFSLSQGLGQWLTLTFKVENLTNPTIEEVFRSPYIEADITNTSYSKGIDYSIALTAEILF